MRQGSIMDFYRRKGWNVVHGRRWLICAAWIMACLMPASGCGEARKEMGDPKAALESVAETYWNKRLIDNNYEAIYEMELNKDSLPFEKYKEIVRNAGQITYISVKTDEAVVEGDRGTVRMSIEIQVPPLKKSTSTTMSDEWVIESNQWRHVLRGRAHMPDPSSMPSN